MCHLPSCSPPSGSWEGGKEVVIKVLCSAGGRTHVALCWHLPHASPPQEYCNLIAGGAFIKVCALTNAGQTRRTRSTRQPSSRAT